MWLGVAWLLAWVGPPEPASADVVAVDAVEEQQLRRRALGRVPSWFGPAIATGLTARHYSEPSPTDGERPPIDGPLAAATILGSVHGRLAGYSERDTGRQRAVLMLLPELMVGLELGGTTSWRDPIAEQRGLAGREGVSFGISGVTTIGLAWASPGLVGAYAGIGVSQRFSARYNADLEGPYWLGVLGPTAGLRVAVRRELTLLIGGGVQGSAGIQRFYDRGRLLAQLAPVVELSLYTQPRPDVYFGLVARGDRTVLGQRYGGARWHGRTSAEVAWELPGTRRVSMVAVLLIYEGTQIDAAAGHPQFATSGERRLSHQLLLSSGISF